jgi:hypothetical protein
MRSSVRAGLACLAAIAAIGAAAIPTGTAAASRPLIEGCAGKIVATRFGVVLVARHFRVTSSNFNAKAVRSYSIRPTVGCRTARRAVRAYLVAKLARPENRCAGPASGGRPCKVGKWLCAKTYPRLAPKPGSPAGMQQTCQHFRFRDGIYVGSTNINFWELDYDHG